ncbi:hypothetical protein MBLNU459_g4229t2 [Dothideomycetes sp. NU459]
MTAAAYAKDLLAQIPPTAVQLERKISEVIASDLKDNIPEKHKQNAIRILQLLTYSERPLRINEVVDAICVDIDENPYFDPSYRMPNPQEISRYCSSLVNVVSGELDDQEHGTQGQELVLQLAHFSVKEYLTSTRLDENTKQYFGEVAAKGSISTICLAFLLNVEGSSSNRQIRKTFPFAQFSARYWMRYAAVAESGNKTLQRFIRQFIRHKDAYEVCYSLYRPDEPGKIKPETHREAAAPPLYYASLGGLSNTTKWLLDNGEDANAQGGRYGNALQAASMNGHKQVVKQLLAAGAEVNAQGGDYDNALLAASARGHPQVVKQLLTAGAKVNAQGGDYNNALQAALARGHQGVVEQLLAAGAVVNAQGGDCNNALQVASARGHSDLVEQLLAAGADVNAQGGDYGNALLAASARGRPQVVEQLLAAGAEVNAQGGDYGNALQVASIESHNHVVKQLLRAGADVNAQGGHYGNALQAASARGNPQIVEQLLAAGAEVNAQGGHYGNALQAALMNDRKYVVKQLLAAGADVRA